MRGIERERNNNRASFERLISLRIDQLLSETDDFPLLFYPEMILGFSCPCLRCAVKIVQTGVKEVIYQLEYSVDDRTRSIFEESGVLFRRYQDPI